METDNKAWWWKKDSPSLFGSKRKIKRKSKLMPGYRGVPVTKALIEWINTLKTNRIVKEKAIELIRTRDSERRLNYKQPLMSQDGRNTVEDALQKMGALLQYLYKAKLNREDMSEISLLIPILVSLIDSSSLPLLPEEKDYE